MEVRSQLHQRVQRQQVHWLPSRTLRWYGACCCAVFAVSCADNAVCPVDAVGYFGIFLFSFIIALIIVLLIFVKPLFPMVKSIVIGSLFNIKGTLFKLVLPLLIQQVLKLILVNGRNEIRNIIIFTLADFAFMVINFVIGALVVIKRSLLIIGGLLLTFWRLDLDWISIDSGHAAWCAMIVIDCRENNPVVITFCDLVFRDINTRRKMIGKQPHIDEDYVSCPIPCCCCIPLIPALKLCYPKP